MAMSGFCRSKHSPKVATLRRRPMRALRDTRRVCPTPAIQVWYPGFRFAHPGYLLVDLDAHRLEEHKTFGRESTSSAGWALFHIGAHGGLDNSGAVRLSRG